MRWLDKTRFVIWDTETTITTLNKRKASPFSPDNWVVAHAWEVLDHEQGVSKGSVYYGAERPPRGWAVPLLTLPKQTVLVGHNIKFDLLHMMMDADNRAAFMDFIANGGEVWDTQLAEYLLQGQRAESFYLSLEDLAAKYGGDPKVSEVKLLWEQGVNTHEIDPDLLMRYLVGDETTLGDIGNTRVVLLAQANQAAKVGQIPSIRLNMGALVATTEMEFNGMYVDEARGEELRAEAVAELAKVQADLQAELPADLPFAFKWSSRFHISALLFGGEVKYEQREQKLGDDGLPLYAMTEEVRYLLTDGTHISAEQCVLPEYSHLAARFKSGAKQGEWKTTKVKVPDRTRPKMHTVEYHYRLPGVVPADAEWESSTPGVYSTDSKVMETLAGRHPEVPLVKLITKRAKLAKDIGTYYYTDEDENGERKGMLTLVQNGIIHHSLNHTSTVTGRLSSSDPNL